MEGIEVTSGDSHERLSKATITLQDRMRLAEPADRIYFGIDHTHRSCPAFCSRPNAAG